MSFTLQTIEKLASSSAVYSRGEHYYNNHAIISYDYEDIGYGEWEVDACILGSGGKRYNVSLHFEQEKLDYMDCNCMAFENYDGACKHIVCTLLKYFYEHVKEKDPWEDEYTRQLLEIYTARNLKNTVQPKEKVKLYPTLHISDTKEPELYLGLSVGMNRKYVVKDIIQFVKDILDNNKVTYGQYLAFVHHINIFDSTSKKIIKFIMRVIRERQEHYIYRYHSPYFGVSANKLLQLTGSSFRDFFELMKGEVLEFQTTYSPLKGDLVFEDGNPPVQFKLSKEDKRFSLEVIPKEYLSFGVYEDKYVLVDNVLYHCKTDFAKEKYPLLKVMKEKIRREEQNKLFFIDRDMKEFCLSVLPQIESRLINQVEQGELEDYIPKPLKIKLYLDSENKEITAKIDFCYGDTTVKPEQKEAFVVVMDDIVKDNIVRDIVKERSFIYELEKWGFQRSDDLWYLSSEEEIYDFLIYGIESLLEICQVNVTDALKSFKIIRSPIASMGIKIKNDLLNVSLETLGMSLDEVLSVLEAYKERKKYYRLKDGSFVNIDEAGVQELADIIDGLDLTDKEKDKGEVTLPKYRALYLDNVAKSNKQIKVERDKDFKQIIRDIKNVEDADYEVPSSLSKILRNYQKTGYRWLKTMSHYKFGGILADDMGLGKTLQIIALLCSNNKEGQSIVICPTSLVINWRNEFEKFAPHMKVLTVQGSAKVREYLISEAHLYDVLITSYELLKRDIELYKKHMFGYIVADEAQYIKNHNTQNSKALKKLKGEYRFALTGTPIENSLAELWSIFDFIMPGYLFGYSKFKKQFETPIVKDKDRAITERLQKFVAPFIMRRLKKDVLDELPEKIETVIYTSMSTEQEKIYKAHLAKAKMDFAKELQSNGFAKSQIKILSILTRLRQICCHPGLFLENYTSTSGKLELCLELIQDSVKGGHRILLFSQFTTMLDKIAVQLEKLEIEYLMLTGSTPSEKRMYLVDEFNAGKIPIFLISLKAGGTGLNLTAADIVIHYDPWWNLSSQNQATDRAYRIGQKNNVQVFQLITKDSIEEKIQKMQERKKDLTDSVIKQGETFISKMSEQDVLELFER